MMGIQNLTAIFCIPLIPLLLGYKIWQPHSVSPKRSKGGYRIWQAYRIWHYTGLRGERRECYHSATVAPNIAPDPRKILSCRQDGPSGPPPLTLQKKHLCKSS